jgi:hypothetical protein
MHRVTLIIVRKGVLPVMTLNYLRLRRLLLVLSNTTLRLTYYIGIGAGVIAGIVIAAVVFAVLAAFGSKKAYDHYFSNKKDLHGVQVWNN